MLPQIKYVLLIEEAMFTVRKFNEFDSIVPLTYLCIKIDNWQNANFAWLEPVLQKYFFSKSEGEGEEKPSLSSNKCCCTPNIILVFGNGKNYLFFLTILNKAISATHLSFLGICIIKQISCVIKYIICILLPNISCLYKNTWIFLRAVLQLSTNPLIAYKENVSGLEDLFAGHSH
jgi:hypothetical protein